MEGTETAPALPDDALEAVLCRLPACTVAVCRCVCKAWRDVVDARGLLLPHTVRGIFLNFIDYRCPRFFARPSSERPGNIGFLPDYSESRSSILDHCNGLLLYGGTFSGEFYVVNPATRRWDLLPPRMNVPDYAAYLVFDPEVSPHYEVFLSPRVPEKPRPGEANVHLDWLFWLPDDTPGTGTEDTEEEEEEEPFNLGELFSLSDDAPVESTPFPRSIEQGFFPTRLRPASSEPGDPMEWPPSPYKFHVFSSCTGCWEERSFVRDGEAMGTIEDVPLDLRPTSGPRWRYGVYWRRALYVHCPGDFVMRLSLTNGTYQVIKTPTDTKESHQTRFYLGRSENGVYFATIENYSVLHVWILDESYGRIEWVLKHHHVDLDPCVLRAVVSDCHEQIDRPWILEDEDIDNNEMLQNGDYEWDSDEDNILDGESDEAQRTHYHYIYFLGFHPYKEIIFLMASFTGIAYHLNTSKVQYLGKLRPDDYYYTFAAGVYESFPYTPCMTGDPRKTNNENHPGNQQYNVGCKTVSTILNGCPHV